MHGWSRSLINVPYGAYLDHCYAWNLQTHFLRVFVANLKNDAIYGFYPESFCDKNLAIRKVFAFSDSDVRILKTSLCDHIDDENNQYILRERLDNKTLALAIEEEIYKYAKSNLAIINIFIKVETFKTTSGDF